MKKFIQLKNSENLNVTVFTEHISFIKDIENVGGYGDGNTIIYMNEKALFIYTHLTYKEVLKLIND